MRYLLTILLSITGLLSAANEKHSVDSLLRQLKTESNSVERINIYRNLTDIYYNKPEEKNYLLQMYQEAKKINDKENIVRSLNDIIILTTKKDEKDSVTKYVNLIRKETSPEEFKTLLPYYSMRFFETLCYLNKNQEAIDEELSFLNSKMTNDENDVYRNIASAYITGISLYINEQIDKSIPYLQNAIKLAGSLPYKDKYKYQQYIRWILCYALARVGQNKEAIPIMQRLIDEVELDYKINIQKQRPFYKINSVIISYYSFMLANAPFMEIEKEKYFWEKIQEIGKGLTNPTDIYNYYICVNNYYMNNRTKVDLNKALSANDTLIKYARTLAPNNLPALYGISSSLYEKMKDYENSLKYLKISRHYQDSLTNLSTQQQLNELQVKFDLNKLNSENSQLEIKNKQNLLIFLLVFLAITIIICTYLYFTLKKEKSMKAELKLLHTKAQESENMKQAFINSMCHEIRTPLNAIVGFSDLIMNTEIDEEVRKDFPAEIQKNTALLTTLINSMLEVANLDVSEDQLPCESTDIRHICIQEMERLKEIHKEGIQYLLDIPDESTFISTHEKYLSLVIEHLLSNANKFTEKGQITLGFQIDKLQKKMLISVTDTGCGIPKEKREEVFDRFSKLNAFIPGNGLGLYLCRLIVKRLSGDIQIDPDYSKGTRIIVSLPT